MEIEVPVSPYIGTITENGEEISDVVLSLYGVVSAKKIRYKLPADTVWKNTIAKWEAGQVSVETLINLGVKSAVTISNQFKGDVKCYNVEICTEQEVENDKSIEGSLIISAKYSVGFRMDVMAYDIKNEAKVDAPAGLAASSTLSLASTLYQVEVMGGGLEALPLLKPILLASTADFNIQTFEQIGAVEDELFKYIKANSTKLTHSIKSVKIDAKELTDLLFPDGTKNYLKDSAAQTFALERALRVETLNEALKRNQGKLNENDIKHVYEKILNLSPDQRPDKDLQNRINWLLNTGRYGGR